MPTGLQKGLAWLTEPIDPRAKGSIHSVPEPGQCIHSAVPAAYVGTYARTAERCE